MKDFFDMGGYAGFVWPAYGLTLAVLVLNIFWATQSLKRSREAARRRVSMSGGES